MTLVRSKPSGFGIHDKLTSVQMELVDSQLPFAVDGHAGGTYDPTARIIIVDGTVATPFEVQGTLLTENFVASGVYEMQGGGAMTGAHTYYVATGATLDVQSGAFFLCHGAATFLAASGNSFQGDTTFTGSKTYVVASGSTWNFASGSSTNFSNTPTFLNGASFNTAGVVGFAVPVQLSGGVIGTAEFAAGVTFDSTTTHTGAATFASTLTYGGTGHEVKRFVTVSGTVDHNYVIADGDRFLITGLTASRNVTFQNTGAQAGISLKVMASGTSGFNVVVKRHDGTTLTTLQDDGASGHVYGAELWHDGSNWFIGPLMVNP